ncbi:MAG: alpha/beta fold hydrolase [Acidimicrobiales bacterium]
MELHRVTVNGIEISYFEDGPAAGPLVLCLHGFPDTAHTWRHLMARLASTGHHAVAPFLRGYAPSSVPVDGAYDTGTLAVDACALHEALGGGNDAVLVGHDWGALTAYCAAAYQPERWRRVVAAAVPPPSAMAKSFFSYDQLRRSWYIFLFQTPLAQHAVTLDGLAFIDRLWSDWSPGFDGGWDVARVKESLGAPEHLSAALGYYRAMLAGAPSDPGAAAAQAAGAAGHPQPTLYLHGRGDGCMGIDSIGGVADALPDGSEIVTVEGAGHFVHLEKPEETNDRLLAFIDG